MIYGYMITGVAGLLAMHMCMDCWYSMYGWGRYEP